MHVMLDLQTPATDAAPGARDGPFAHFGVQRTGSSSVRRLIEHGCGHRGRSWTRLGAHDLDDDAAWRHDFLLFEVPAPLSSLARRRAWTFTFVREPVATALSSFLWRLQAGIDDDTNPFDRAVLAAPDPLAAFVSGLPESYNFFSRWMHALASERVVAGSTQQLQDARAGQDFYRDIPDGELFEAAMDTATGRLDYVGLFERLHDSLFGLFAAFGWRRVPVVQRRNPSVVSASARTLLARLNADHMAKLGRCTEIDRRVYDRLRAHVAPALDGIAGRHEDDLRAYRLIADQCVEQSLGRLGMRLVKGRVVEGAFDPAETPMSLRVPASIRERITVIDE